MEQRRQAEPRPPTVPHTQPPKLQVEDKGEHRQTQAQTAPPPAGASSNEAEEEHARSRNSTGRSFSFGFRPSRSPLVAGPWGRAREGIAARRGAADMSVGPCGGSWLGHGGRRAGAALDQDAAPEALRLLPLGGVVLLPEHECSMVWSVQEGLAASGRACAPSAATSSVPSMEAAWHAALSASPFDGLRLDLDVCPSSQSVMGFAPQNAG